VSSGRWALLLLLLLLHAVGAAGVCRCCNHQQPTASLLWLADQGWHRLDWNVRWQLLMMLLQAHAACDAIH
jgi:nitric oxide reductase large subunit